MVIIVSYEDVVECFILAIIFMVILASLGGGSVLGLPFARFGFLIVVYILYGDIVDGTINGALRSKRWGRQKGMRS